MMKESWRREGFVPKPADFLCQSYAPIMPPDPYPSPYEKPTWGRPPMDDEEYVGN